VQRFDFCSRFPHPVTSLHGRILVVPPSPPSPPSISKDGTAGHGSKILGSDQSACINPHARVWPGATGRDGSRPVRDQKLRSVAGSLLPFNRAWWTW
jgi:hypothetical protein